MGPGNLCCILMGPDHNCPSSTPVAPEKCTGSHPLNPDVHSNTTGGTKTDEFVVDPVAVSVSALGTKDALTDDKTAVPGETGSLGEARLALCVNVRASEVVCSGPIKRTPLKVRPK